jgi:hypothetical protein
LTNKKICPGSTVFFPKPLLAAADRIEFFTFSGLCEKIFAHLPHLVKSGYRLGDEYSTEPVPFSQLCELDS